MDFYVTLDDVGDMDDDPCDWDELCVKSNECPGAKNHLTSKICGNETLDRISKNVCCSKDIIINNLKTKEKSTPSNGRGMINLN